MACSADRQACGWMKGWLTGYSQFRGETHLISLQARLGTHGHWKGPDPNTHTLQNSACITSVTVHLDPNVTQESQERGRRGRCSFPSQACKCASGGPARPGPTAPLLLSALETVQPQKLRCCQNPASRQELVCVIKLKTKKTHTIQRPGFCQTGPIG